MTLIDPITEYSIDEIVGAARDIVCDAIDNHTSMDIAVRRAIAQLVGGDPQTDDIGEMLLEHLTDLITHLKIIAAKPEKEEPPSVARRRLLKAAEDAARLSGDNNPDRARVLLDIANAYTAG